MNKKIIIPIIVIIVILVLGALVYMFTQNSGNSENENRQNNNLTQNETNENQDNSNNDNNVNANGNSVVVYFSATGNTKKIANLIGQATGSNVIEIEPEDEYTDDDLDYSNDDCHANKEQNDDDARPEIKNDINVDNYEVIYLGYPIWWGDVPKIILTFIDTHNLDGKTIIPFCTSGSSSITTSVSTLRNYNSNMNVLNGNRFSTSSNLDDVTSWIDSLGL